ncbi:MAG TPA: hypothetical protein DF409_08380 [Bacteroidales bacterium]|nr:hypothetical protein [Bacteroidales bacterium]
MPNSAPVCKLNAGMVCVVHSGNPAPGENGLKALLLKVWDSSEDAGIKINATSKRSCFITGIIDG